MKKLISPHLRLPLLLVLAMFLSFAAWTVLMTMGSMPFQVRNIGVESVDGVSKSQFLPGEIVGVRREVCADRDIAVEFFPGLRTPTNGLMSLGHSAAFMRRECRQTVFLFTLPLGLPPGHYSYVNIVKYQSNLIGRDEQTVYPPLDLEVVNAE